MDATAFLHWINDALYLARYASNRHSVYVGGVNHVGNAGVELRISINGKDFVIKAVDVKVEGA